MKRGNPGAYKIGGIAGPKELFASVKHIFMVFTPPHAGAVAEGIGDSRHGRERAQRQLEGPGQIRRAVFVDQGKGLLFAEAELVGLFIVGDVATGCL